MPKTPAKFQQLNVLSTRLALLGLIILTWEALVRLFKVPGYLIPLPSDLFRSYAAAASQVKDLESTTLEAVLGFVFANLLAFFVAIVFAHSQSVEKAFLPYAIAMKTTPVVAMAPLLVLWLGSGVLSKVVASALVSFFPILVNASRGFRDIDKDALNLFKTLNASRLDIFLKLRLPSALPFIFSALKISSSLAVVGAIVGEFVGAQQGLGYAIVQSSYHMETVKMFTAVIFSAIIGVSMFALIVLVEKLTLRWADGETD